MPGEMARSDPRPSFGQPELLVAIHASRQSCSKAGKARIFVLVWGSSGESRFIGPLPTLARVVTMGIDYQGLRFVLFAKRAGVSFEHPLMFGRQQFGLSLKDA